MRLFFRKYYQFVNSLIYFQSIMTQYNIIDLFLPNLYECNEEIHHSFNLKIITLRIQIQDILNFTHIKLLDFSEINGEGQYLYIYAYNFHTEMIPKFVLIIAITWIAWSVPDRIVYILCSKVKDTRYHVEFSKQYDHCLV